jgi:hypothetical protein
MVEKEKSVEKGWRKHEELAGSWVLLGDGSMWCVPALPLGAGCLLVLEKLEKLYDFQDQAVQTVGGDIKAQLALTRKVIEAGADFAYTVLNLNYPGLTREYFDQENLVTMQHISVIQSIVQGEKELGEIIGEPSGEGKMAAI